MYYFFDIAIDRLALIEIYNNLNKSGVKNV